MKQPARKQLPRTPGNVRIPPVVVGAVLLARLKKIAKAERRTLSDVIRCAIRDGLDHRGVGG